MNKLSLILGIITPFLLVSPSSEIYKSTQINTNNGSRRIFKSVEAGWLNKYQDSLNYYIKNVRDNILEYKMNKQESLYKIEELEGKSKTLESLNRGIKEDVLYLDQEIINRIENNKCNRLK